MGEVFIIDIVVETLGDFVDLFGKVGDLLYQSLILLLHLLVLLMDLCN